MKSYIVEKNGEKYQVWFDNNSEPGREEDDGIVMEVWFRRKEWDGELGNDDNRWCYINRYFYRDRKGYLSLLFNKRPASVCREYLKKLGFKVIGTSHEPITAYSYQKPYIPKLENEIRREEEK